ncbi:hypothetical protein CB0940_06904 [Cercospora beticola]|uniref:Uncharacterized protein n=1 Tax=Cercospora beticola TaxID=122368 RepID=A0A2G5H8Z6_CERBT|nr:hypothetical protein CB0940_06904 [Cercospora beticola]PIA88773.1 hypothetical protein CB0940_06904 [Cercospora beticola]WPB02822.1 hypothetical protein RHO25_007458 [Cercospora beticola]
MADDSPAGSDYKGSPSASVEPSIKHSSQLRPKEERMRLFKERLNGSSRKSTASAEDSARNAPGELLWGKLLAATARKEAGSELSPLENRLVGMMQRFVPDEEVLEYGRMFAESVKSNSASGVHPQAVEQFDLQREYTDNDFHQDIGAIADEFAASGGVQIIDGTSPTFEADCEALGEREGDINQGTGPSVIAFVGPNDRIKESDPAPAAPAADIQNSNRIWIRLHLTKFVCQRRSGEVGKDELYFTTAVGTDLSEKQSKTTKEYGSIKQGTERWFDNENMFQGYADQWVAIECQAWEADNSNDQWYNDLMNTMRDIGYELMQSSVGARNGGFSSNKYAAMVGAVTVLVSYLMEVFRNKDDFVAKKELVISREFLNERMGTNYAAFILEGGGGGVHKVHWGIGR